MKTWIKKYWWIVAVIALIIVAVIFFWPKKVVPVVDDTVSVHRFDSLVYIHSNDSLKGVITTLEAEIVKRSAVYARTVAILNSKISTVQTLPANDVVEVFSDRVYVDVKLRSDSNVIVPLQGIRNAVVMIYRMDAAIAGLEYYSGQDSLQREVIGQQKQLLAIKDTRIVNLTSEFYQSQSAITGLRADIAKQQRKVRNRNTLIGIVAGAGAVAILVAVLK